MYVTAKNIKESGVSLDNMTFVTSEVFRDVFSRCNPELGDILYIKDGATTGVVTINDIKDPFCLLSSVALIKPSKSIDRKYLLYYLRSSTCYSSVRESMKGVGITRVTLKQIENWVVPIPPLSEQKRIVDEVEKWFVQIDAIEQDSSDLKDAVQKAKSKILDLALSGRLTSDTSHYPQLPQIRVTRWEAKTIDEIFNHNTGKALNKSDSDGELYDYITTSNLYWNIFDLSSVRKMKFKSSEIEKCSVRKGDLLICEGGDVGRAAVWNYDFNIMIQNHIHRLRCRLEANPKFYYYVMMYYKSKGMISGKGIGLMGLSSKELGKLQVPYPQIEEQNDIVTYLDYTMKVFDSIAD